MSGAYPSAPPAYADAQSIAPLVPPSPAPSSGRARKVSFYHASLSACAAFAVLFVLGAAVAVTVLFFKVATIQDRLDSPMGLKSANSDVANLGSQLALMDAEVESLKDGEAKLDHTLQQTDGRVSAQDSRIGQLGDRLSALELKLSGAGGARASAALALLSALLALLR